MWKLVYQHPPQDDFLGIKICCESSFNEEQPSAH